MIKIIEKILLLIALITLPSGIAYASADDNISMFEDEFDYSNVVRSPQSETDMAQLAVIENAYNYVVITALMYAFVLVIITILMKITPQHQAKDIVTVIGLVSVIFGAILLVLVVDTTDALTAPMGILGAIAGYLFGRTQKSEG
jgi:archaellum biogenesis protein FlaJ (TadC family)